MQTTSDSLSYVDVSSFVAQSLSNFSFWVKWIKFDFELQM